MAAQTGTEDTELKTEVVIERGNAVLTERQRQLLTADALPEEMAEKYGVNEMSDGGVRAHRSKARKRLLDSIADMYIVSSTFHPEDYNQIRYLLDKDSSELDADEETLNELLIEGVYGMMKIAYELQDVGDMPPLDHMLAVAATDYHQRKVSHVIDSDHEHEFRVEVTIKDVPENVDLVELVEKAEDDPFDLTDNEQDVLKYYLSEDDRFRRMTEKQIGEHKTEILMR